MKFLNTRIKISQKRINYYIILWLLQGISGPSSVYVNVICERKHTADPVSIIIDIGGSS